MTQSISVAHRLTTSVVTNYPEVEGLSLEWFELLARSSSNDAMLTSAWLMTWWEVFGSLNGRQLQVVLFRDDERLVGLAPLLKRHYWYRPGIPFRRIEPFGSGERERDAICSDYLNVIAERGCEQQVAEALAAAVIGGALGSWDEFVLPMMDGDGPMPKQLVAAFKDKGVAAEALEIGGAPYIPLPSSWDDYLQTLSKKHRYRINRVQRDFEEWAGEDWRVERVATPSDLVKGKQILVNLHHDRWNGAAHSGVFRSPYFLRFHDLVMPRLLERKALELTWLSVRGEPVAVNYSIVWNDKVSYYQCGRKTGLPQQVRPGSVLLHHAIRAAIEEGRREFDFLNGIAPYKMYLALAVRPLVQVRAVRPSFVERLRRMARWGWRQTKRL